MVSCIQEVHCLKDTRCQCTLKTNCADFKSNRTQYVYNTLHIIKKLGDVSILIFILLNDVCHITISDDYIFVFFVFLAVSINKAGLQINTRIRIHSAYRLEILFIFFWTDKFFQYQFRRKNEMNLFSQYFLSAYFWRHIVRQMD